MNGIEELNRQDAKFAEEEEERGRGKREKTMELLNN
jgi:hypothetical protein